MNQADIAIQYAMAQIGKPYCWGGIGPSCFDCSGLVMSAFQVAGVKLPRTTFSQVGVGTGIDRNSLAPGDLVFPDPGHVQIFIGGNQIIEAPRTGIPVRTVAMWGFWQARRVTAPGGGAGLADAIPGVPASTKTGNTGCLAGVTGLLFAATLPLAYIVYRKGRK